MIVVDTSALIAILLKEPEAHACMSALARADTVLISAPTFTETHIVAGQKGVSDLLADLLGFVKLEIVPLDEAAARRAAGAYTQWGRNYHRAELNFGDSFSYSLAKFYDCPLLYIGDDFAQTDIVSAIPRSPHG